MFWHHETAQVKQTANFLNSLLPLLFVSPTVRIAEQWSLIQSQLLPIFLVLAASTFLTFGISYIVSNLMMVVKFLLPAKKKENDLNAAAQKKAKTKFVIALALGFLIGAECGFMGSAGGVLMLLVLTMVLGMDTKLAVGTSSLVMMLVALTGAVSHVAMGARIDLIPSIVVTVMCTIGVVGSSQFANKVEERKLNRSAGVVLLVVSVVSLLLSA